MKLKKVISSVLAMMMGLSVITIMPHTSSADELLVMDTFDISYDGWGTLGDLTLLTADEEAARTGTRGMIVENRLNSSDGAFSNKGFYIDGGKSYDYSIWVKPNASETFSFVLSYHYEDGTKSSQIIDSKFLNAGEWAELSASCKAPVNALELTLNIKSDGISDFCFDDVSILGTPTHYNDVSAAEVGLQDVYANYFRIGTALPSSAISNSTLMALVLKEFNSVTCENEMKPDATMNQTASSGNNIAVTLNSCASILNYCVQNKIAVRGHTLVWHSQTPLWIFKENFNASGNWVSTAVMDQRMESYIKNMFEALATQYPTLDLYAYDVVNEAWLDDGSPRTAGSDFGSGQSGWVQVYGGNSFIEKAFTYSREYAPSNCKLFYNDFNEYIQGKRDAMYNMANSLKSKGVIDGIGMQSHLAMNYPDITLYSQALSKFASLGLEIQVTELDITTDNGDLTAQGQKFGQIMQAIVDCDKAGGNVTAVVFWGTTDDRSWRSSGQPLLFNSSMQEKAAYTQVYSIIPREEWGDGSDVNDDPPVIVPIEPDENGYFFHTTFEDGIDNWSGRGDATITIDSSVSNKGEKSASITTRADSWNGIARSLGINPFAPGSSFSFSAMAMYQTGAATETFKLTLQYTGSDGEDHYDEVASIEAVSGQWVQLANTSFEIPTGATGLILYVETVDSTIDFYVDELIGAEDGVTIDGGGPIVDLPMLGDIIEDGVIDAKDIVALAQYNARLMEFTSRQLLAADVFADGEADAKDLVKLVQYNAKLITSLD